MGVSVESLIAGTRLDSGLRNNRLFSDDQIAEKLTDAYADLRDLMIVRFAFWFKKTFDFTLAGGNSGNVLTLSENVPDLEMVQGVNFVDSQGNPQTVTMLSSFAERNQYNASYPFALGNSFNGFTGRKYFVNGDDLEILPAANSAGTYQLIYTPSNQTLALPITRTFDIESSDTNPSISPTENMPGPGFWAFANGDFNAVQFGGGFTTDIPIDGTAYIDTNFSAGPPDNTSFNSRWFINGVSNSSSNEVSVSVAPTGTVTGPAAGTAAITYQPVGTIGELPDVLTPWRKYLQLHASIAIRTSRRQPIASLDLQFQREIKKIVAITKQRSQGVTQAPITQTNWGGGGYGWGQY